MEDLSVVEVESGLVTMCDRGISPLRIGLGTSIQKWHSLLLWLGNFPLVILGHLLTGDDPRKQIHCFYMANIRTF